MCSYFPVNFRATTTEQEYKYYWPNLFPCI